MPKPKTDRPTRVYAAHLCGDSVSIISRGPSADLFAHYSAAAYVDGEQIAAADHQPSEPAALSSLLEQIAAQYVPKFEKLAAVR